jgi:hypothetical protein
MAALNQHRWQQKKRKEKNIDIILSKHGPLEEGDEKIIK